MKKIPLLTLGIASSLLIASASERIGNAIDVNGDGRIDVEEHQASRSLQRDRDQARNSNYKKITAPITRAAMKKEIDQRRNDRFLEADTDGDRVLSVREFYAIPAVTRLHATQAAKAFRSLDRDSNRLISLREFTQRLTELRTKVNSNSSTRSAKIQAKETTR